MRTHIIHFFIIQILFTTQVFGQSSSTCKCEQDFDYVVHFIENNFPGFDKNVTPENRIIYEKFKSQLNNRVKEINSKNECLKYLTYYVEFFKDNHTKMRARGGNKIDESIQEEVNSFLASNMYKQTETISISESQLLDEFSIDDIRGIYISSDSTYKIALIESKTDFRDYVGVIINSTSKLWTKGQVKFEIRWKKDNVYEGFAYDRYHRASYKTTISFNNGFLGNTWVKEKKKERINFSLNLDEKFNYIVRDSTVIIRISSFMGRFTQTIDSLFKEAKSDIENNPYLLIDVRDNGGGNSSNFYSLIPYFYTNPILDEETADLYATKDIIQLYEDAFSDIMKDSTQVNAETIQAFREGIEEMKNAKPNSFITQGETETLIMEPKSHPKKVGILYNRGCASACEDLLFKAKFSSKTVLIGDNSGGFVGYGNIFTVYTPEYGLGLSCSTTRYSTQWKYEVVGIEPDFKLDYNKDWIDQSIDLLKK